MRQVYSLPILLLSLFAACVDLPTESTTSQDVSGGISPDRIGTNRIGTNRIGTNRIGTNRLAAQRLTNARLVNGNLMVNMTTATELLSTDDGRQVFSALVGCALPQNVAVHATVAGTDFEFDGDMGLAPQWLFAALDPIGQRWVSACMFSLVSAKSVAVPVSLRGPHPALSVPSDERADFPLEEGAFFGNLFVPLSEPIQWFACRGRDLLTDPTDAGFADRDCAKPDPANPGMTQCGFFFAGDCGKFAADRACDAFVPAATFYVGCHTRPITRHSPDDDAQLFHEVITTFVTP